MWVFNQCLLRGNIHLKPIPVGLVSRSSCKKCPFAVCLLAWMFVPRAEPLSFRRLSGWQEAAVLDRLPLSSSHTSLQAQGTVEGVDRSRQFQTQCWAWHFLGRTYTVHLLEVWGVCISWMRSRAAVTLTVHSAKWPPPLTQPCISLLELLNDSKNGRKVGSAGNLLSSRKMVVGEQIAIIVTILNTKKLSQERLGSQLTAFSLPTRKSPFPQPAHHLNSDPLLVQEHKDQETGEIWAVYTWISLCMLEISTIFLRKASLLPWIYCKILNISDICSKTPPL